MKKLASLLTIIGLVPTYECQSKSVTMTKQFTYDQTKETIIELKEKIADFFVKFCNAITDAIFWLF